MAPSPMESIITKNLIPHIDATYRTIATREGRAIEGHSMGGFGALHNGFKNPDLFIAVTGNAPGGATLDMGEVQPELWTIDSFSIVYGSDRDYYVAMAPTTLAAKNVAKLRQQAIRIICGTEDDALLGRGPLCTMSSRSSVFRMSGIPVPGSPHNHDQLLQYQTFDTMAFYGKVFGKTNMRSAAGARRYNLGVTGNSYEALQVRRNRDPRWLGGAGVSAAAGTGRARTDSAGAVGSRVDCLAARLHRAKHAEDAISDA